MKSQAFCLQALGKDLPVTLAIPDLIRALAFEKRAVLQAPPGAGKTTFVPLALLDQPWLSGKKIVMLEPRRLAAKACAAHMAWMLGESPGQTVGYQIRMERRIGPDTRIEVITEGILTRRIQADPSLERVGLVIFDEFHERHIHSDLGLAFCLEAAEVFNQDLRILVMSATVDMAAMSALMDNAPMVASQGRSYPVVTHYLSPEAAAPARRHPYPNQDRYRGIRSACLSAVEKSLAQESGDILVFLPGVREIKNMAQALKSLLPLTQSGQPSSEISILPLFGNLSRTDQAAAIAPSLPGHRKIVLATAIAETSLTIEGVRVVVDTGLMRVPRFSPGTGMGQLDTILVSRASADQRRGRAGRTGPGVCYRIWSRHLDQGLVPFNRPEILSADLTSLVLELAQWGVSDPKTLKWLDLPPETSFAHAKALLIQLKGLDTHGRITPHGRKLLSAGVHPRLAHMILKADQMGQGRLACRLAALLGERDILLGTCDPDIRLRLEVLVSLSSGRSLSRSSKGGGNKTTLTHDLVTSFNESLVRTILKNAAKIEKDLNINSAGINMELSGSVLAFAWPGRVAKKRNNKDLSFLMASGSGAFFRSANSLSFLSYIVAVHLDGNPRNAGIFLAAPYSEKDLEQEFKDQIQTQEECFWNKQTQSVQSVLKARYGKLVIRETMVANPDPEAVRAGMIQGIQETGLDILPWTKKLRHFQERVVFLKNCGHFSGLPDLSDMALSGNLFQWLGPFLDHVHSATGLRQVDLSSALTSLLTWEQQQALHLHAPTHLTVPSGSRIFLQYLGANGLLKSPVLAVRLQEMFGLTKSPAIARGKIPITLHLLSPAGRPVQITQDLESFWKNTYPAVKKDLMGRYPKHYWPEDPLSAEPMKRAKPRG